MTDKPIKVKGKEFINIVGEIKITNETTMKDMASYTKPKYLSKNYFNKNMFTMIVIQFEKDA